MDESSTDTKDYRLRQVSICAVGIEFGRNGNEVFYKALLDGRFYTVDCVDGNTAEKSKRLFATLDEAIARIKELERENNG